MNHYGFGWSSMALGLLAAALAVTAVPRSYRFTSIGSGDPRRSPGSRSHKRWKRIRASGRATQ